MNKSKDFGIPRSEVEHIIDEWCFVQKYRWILKLSFLDGYTIREIAEAVDMSDRQVQRILKKEGEKVLIHIPLKMS